MKSAQLQQYINKITGFLSNENGKKAAPLLSIYDSHVNNILERNIQIENLDYFKHQKLTAPWHDFIINHIKTVLYIDRGDYSQAFETQKEVVQAFQKTMSNLTRWCLPILYVINNDLKSIATQADLEMTTAVEGTRKKLEEAANVISKSFTYCITDRGVITTSKKYGTYYMIGILFRIYFKLKQQNLCKNILRALRAADMPPIDQFPKSDRVTFRYYLGRLYFLEEEYGKAEIELELAFQECHKRQTKNKELILQTLLPVKLMRGTLPTDELFRQYPKASGLYKDLAESIKKGDVKSFNKHLSKSESTFISQGTYFAIEKAESIAIRQLFRKVYISMDMNTRLPIGKFKQALEFEGLNVDIEEAEWMLANMIFKGYMKGYLSHEKMFLVLSKDNPFPPVAQVARS